MTLKDMSFHRQGGWRNQFQRLQRWHERVKQIKDGISPGEQDVIYAFFQNCLALKDSLKNTYAIASPQLNKFFNSHSDLKLCRDVANGTKHYSLNSPSVDANFLICREYVPMGSNAIRPRADSRLVMCADGTQTNLLELADRCVELWIQFLEDQGLLPLCRPRV